MREYWDALLDLVFPTKCLFCEGPGELVCGGCLASLPRVDGPICRLCGKPTLHQVETCRECRGRRFAFASARSVWVYSGRAKQMVHGLKYRNERRLSVILARELVRAHPVDDRVDVITWVPLSRRRQRRRGFNQAKLLAVSLAMLSGSGAAPLLRRVVHTGEQSKLDLESRQRNVRGAFVFRGKESVAGKTVLLVDDVFTTGSTLHECCKALRGAGAEKVYAVTVCRTLRHE